MNEVSKDLSFSFSLKNKLSVLIIDDEEEQLSFLGDLIKNIDPDADVISFQDCRDSLIYLLEKLHDNEIFPDLIILDLLMPGMSGFDFLEKLEKFGIQLNVIILTASTDIQNELVSKLCGAKEYITKPVSMTKLQTAMKSFGLLKI